MKRRASDSDIGKALKRRARGSAGALSMCIPTWKPPSPIPTLSKQALRSVDQQIIKHTSTLNATHTSTRFSTHAFPYSGEQTLASIRRWLNDIGPEYEPPMVPTPRSTIPSTRHISKHQRYSSYTKATKATKTVAPQAYRQQNMHSACIYVDQVVELPPQVDEYIRHVLGITSWEDRVPVPNQLGSQRRFLDLAETFWSQSKNCASKCALEGDWQCNLYQLVITIADLLGGVLETNVSEKLWNPQLIQKLSSLDKSRNEAEEPAYTDSPGIDASIGMVTDYDPSESMSLCSHSNSVISTARTNVKSSSDILTPKPDITIGLTHKAFAREHQRLLIDYQDRGLILSDPHAAVMGMRFPFMIAEMEGAIPISKAQNQAAVGGACMLTILEDLACQAARSTNLQAPPLATPVELSPALMFCFSAVTEGPVHELWVHFKRGDGFHMVNVKIWRTTMRGHAEELVNCLGRIAEWGKEDFKEHIVEMLGRVPNL